MTKVSKEIKSNKRIIHPYRNDKETIEQKRGKDASSSMENGGKWFGNSLDRRV